MDPILIPLIPAHHVQACLWGTEYLSMMAVSRSREHFCSRLSCADDWRLISSEAEFRLGRCEFWKLCQRSFLGTHGTFPAKENPTALHSFITATSPLQHQPNWVSKATERSNNRSPPEESSREHWHRGGTYPCLYACY